MMTSLAVERAAAQGFGVFEQGTCTMGRAGAAVANTCDDGSAIFFNPAGLAGDQGLTVAGGVTFVTAFGEYMPDNPAHPEVELENDPIPVPHLFLAYGVNEQLSAGLGVFVPYGLGTTWPTDDDFRGRFLGYDNHLQSIYIQPTLAYQITDALSIGAGFDVVIGRVELNQRVDLAEQVAVENNPDTDADDVTFARLGIPEATDFADAGLVGNGTGFGGNIGIQYQATDWLHFGARFLTPITIEYSGEADFESVPTGITLPAGNPFGVPAGTPLDAIVASQFEEGGTLVTQDVETEITLPAQAVVGASIQATEQVKLLVDYQWTGWSSFDRLPLDFEQDALDGVQIENYEDTHALRLGAEFAVNDAWTLRGGFLTHTAAAPEETITPLLPEGYRNEFTAGIGWKMSSGVAIDLAYQFIAQNDVRGRVTELEGDPTADDFEFDTAVDNDGLYSFGAHLFGATVSLNL